MAGEGDAERLVVLLEARIRDFEKNIAKASGTAERGYNRMRRGARSATRQMETDMVRSTTRINQALAASSTQVGSYGQVMAARLGPLGAGMSALGPAGLVAAAGIGALVLGLKSGITAASEADRILRRLDAVLKVAGNAAGLTAKEINAFAGDLEKATGIAAEEINAAAAALATYTNISGDRFKDIIRLSTDMVAVYGGNLREWTDKIARAVSDPIEGFAALKRAGFQLTDAQLSLVTSMRDVGDVAGYQSEMLKILSESLGGTAAAQNAGMAGAATRAKDAIGAFLEEMARWTLIRAPVEGTLNAIANGLDALATKAERMRETELSVGFNVVRLNRDLADVEDRLERMRKMRDQNPTSIAPDQISALEQQRDTIAAQIDALIARGHQEVADVASAETGERIAQWNTSTELIEDAAKAATESGKAYLSASEKLAALGNTYDETKAKIAQARELWKASSGDLKSMTDEEKAAFDARGAAIDEWAAAEEDAFRRQQAALQQQVANEAKRGSATAETRDRVKELIAALEEEVRLIGASDTDRAVSNSLRLAGAAATEEQRKQIEQLVRTIDAGTEAHDRFKAQVADAKRLARDFAGSLVHDLMDGKSATEALSNAFANLAQKLLDMAMDQAIGGLFDILMGGARSAPTSLLPGFRASGGPVQAGKPYIVGEKRPELFVPDRNGTIIPTVPSAASARMPGGGNVTVNQNLTFTFQNVDPTMRPWVRAQIQQALRESVAATTAAVRAGRRNNPGYFG